MTAPVIGVGVIGVGNIGTAHAENLARTVAGDDGRGRTPPRV